jgi:hypothetical protein
MDDLFVEVITKGFTLQQLLGHYRPLASILPLRLPASPTIWHEGKSVYG